MARIVKSILSEAWVSAGGTVNLDLGLPKGTLKRLEAWTLNAAGNAACTLYQLYLYDSAAKEDAMHIFSNEPLIDATVIAWDGNLNIPAYWGIRATFNGTVAGDTVSINAVIEVGD